MHPQLPGLSAYQAYALRTKPMQCFRVGSIRSASRKRRNPPPLCTASRPRATR
ncbi:hypothetical protein B484DRAFT_443018 [Ochromonadaceae sp. CCMP2298]|nr:hypothetical protein B484DRAFT_443018 [Ochromonadaceae sp. CCMP2298]